MLGNSKDYKDKKNQEKVSTNVENETNFKRGSKKLTEKSEKSTFWITRSIAEEIGREEVLKRTLIEFIVYAGFLILSTIYITGTTTTSVYYLTKGLKQQFLEQPFTTLNDVEIVFGDIKSAADFWFYLENHMINSIFWESTYDPTSETDENAMNILHENKVLGVPRLRQVKVRNDSCTVHTYFRKLFLNCFDAYSTYSEDKDPFGLQSGTGWVYSSSKTTMSLPHWGKISTYDGGGYYIDFSPYKNESVQLIQDLKDNLWITRGTRAAFVDFSVYNANLNIFGICKLIFEFPVTGGVIPSAIFESVRLLRFHTNFDWFVLVCQCCCYIFLVFYISEEIREMIYFKTQYLTKFWNYIDLLIIATFIGALVISMLLIIEVPLALKEIEKSPEKYGNLEYATELHYKHNAIMAIALYFIYLKLFKFLNINKTMGQLNNTLSKCAMDIMGFSVMFFIIFFAYAELGYLLFGNQVDSFSSFGIAMFTLLRTILGDFNYQQIEEANRILAPIYFLSYIFLVFLVSLNMFLAIISDTYSDVKTEIALAPDEMQMTEYVQKHFGKFLKKIGFGRFLSEKYEVKDELNVTIREIREALKKCGYSDLEIEMFFARFNISPLAEMHINESDKLLEELKNVLEHENGKENDYVKLNDFLSQQEKLKEIEKTIGELVRHLNSLLLKLESMENVIKEKKV